MSTLKLNNKSLNSGIATIGIIGGIVSGFGVLVPFYIDKFNLDIEIGGRLFALTGLSGIIGVALTSYLLDKIPGKIAGILGILFTFIGIIILTIAGTWNNILIGVVFIGAGFGAAQAGISQLVVDVGGLEAARRSNKNNISFAVSSILVPIIFGLLLNKFYQEMFLVFSIACLVIAYVFFKNTQGQLFHKPESEHKGQNHNLTIVLLLLGISTYVGVESALTGWIPTFLQDKGWSSSKASFGLSVFFLVILVVRLFVLKYLHKLNFGLLTIISVICLIPALFLMYTSSLYWVAIVLLGTACSPIFPMAFAWVIDISPGNARITGFIFFSSISGSMIFPYLIGSYMNQYGTQYAPLFMMVPSVLALLFFLSGYRTTIQKLVK